MQTRIPILDPTRVLRVLGVVTAALLFLSLTGQYLLYVQRWDVATASSFFDVGREHNLPTTYSVFLLIACAIVLAVLASRSHQAEQRDWYYWALLSLGFSFMAFDEGNQVHEHLVGPMQSLLGGGNLGLLNYAWIVPGAIVALCSGLFFLGFVRRLPGRTRRGIILAAALYLGGCLGVEALGGGYDANHGHRNMTYSLLAAVEEGLEMVGLVVFLSTLLAHLGQVFGGLTIRVGGDLNPLPQTVWESPPQWRRLRRR